MEQPSRASHRMLTYRCDDILNRGELFVLLKIRDADPQAKCQGNHVGPIDKHRAPREWASTNGKGRAQPAMLKLLGNGGCT